ncbi:MAG: GNAT family N-acetyltransferase, partial [Bacteroidales bacterium]|nr:GNAT family N-acetyltransferase [Bacteroidales bacterium]
FVARIGERVVGMLMITLEWSDWRNGWVWWIQSVYVEQEFRKDGIFRSLYTYIRNLVENSDSIRGLRLYVDKRNIKAQKVYNALGMTGEHYTTYEWMKND